MFSFMKIGIKGTRAALMTGCLGAAVLACVPAGAQQLDDGSKARINLANKLGMLSQRVAGAACRIDAGVGVDAARAELGDARVAVRVILDGLEDGNMTLGIPSAERRSRTIRALRAARAEWQEMSPAIDALIGGDEVAANAGTIFEAATAFQQSSQTLASEISAHYANPNELLLVDAIAINMAARQRMLIQRIAAESCLLASGGDAADRLTESARLFERTLIALRDGFPEVGVRKPPNDAVLNKITDSWDAWTTSRETIDGLLAGAPATGDTIAAIADTSGALERDMNDLVVLYMLSTPGRDGAIRGVMRDMADTELSTWVQEPALIAAVKAQNERHAALSVDAVIAMDNKWRAEAEAGGGPMIEDLMSRPLSRWLQDRQVATAGFINEIFVMDMKGLNVAQSAVTSDLWQGDEAKFQQSYGDGSGEGAVHISDVEFDDSTGVFQSQVSIPVRDPATGGLLGAITFGVNVQSLL